MLESYFESCMCVCVCVDRMAATVRASHMERPELGYESMSHFVLDTDDVAVMLMNVDFCSGMPSFTMLLSL